MSVTIKILGPYPSCTNCDLAEKEARNAGLIIATHDPKDTRWIHYSINHKKFQEVRQELITLFDESKDYQRTPNCPTT